MFPKPGAFPNPDSDASNAAEVRDGRRVTGFRTGLGQTGSKQTVAHDKLLNDTVNTC